MIALLIAAQVAAQAPAEQLPAKCGNARAEQLIDYKKTVSPEDGALANRLGDLPKGRLEKAVQRSVDGCIVPVYVNYDPEQKPISRGAAPISGIVAPR